ncbi:MAG: hypothetical protein HY303_03860 [Candidatus Wallbacteria bacterium]|nr:hypothetical protein [Candidatus Wallbacteria bacterium]
MTNTKPEAIRPAGALLAVDMPWDRSTERTINGLLEKHGKALLELKKRAGKTTYEESVLAFDAVLGELDEIAARSSWAFNTNPAKPARDKAEQTSQLMSKLWSRLFTIRLPYDVIKDVSKRLGPILPWDRVNYLKDLLRGFEQNGVHLPEDRKRRIYAIDSELAEIGTRFSKALKDREVLVELTAEQAAPYEARSLRKGPKSGKPNLVLRQDTFNETLRSHPDARVRKLVYDKYFRATGDLAGDLDRLRQLRRERSRLVANTSYVALEAQNEGFTPDEVRNSLDELVARTTRRFRESMTDYRQLNGGERIYTWDLLYLEEHAPTEGLDPQILQEYLSGPRTVAVLLELSTQLYGLTFKAEAGDAKHRVERYTVFGPTGKKVGAVAFDLYPRPEKFSHAACWTLRGRASAYPSRTADMGLVCNFKERSLPGDAKGLMWEDVNTCFHEYGHVLHGLLINAEPLGCHSVPRSLVEVPSQVFENWAYDPAVLDRLARHYKTGAPLTDELKHLVYRKHQRFAARHLRTQILYALFDLEFHEHTDQDPQKIWERLAATIFGAGFYPAGLPWFTRFGHLDGYGAKYWGYKFADLGKSQLYWYVVHHYPDLLSRTIGHRMVDELLRFGGLKKLNQVALDFTGIPLTGLPYILETLFEYPRLRATIEANRHLPYQDELEAAFLALAGKPGSVKPDRRKKPRA